MCIIEVLKSVIVVVFWKLTGDFSVFISVQKISIEGESKVARKMVGNRWRKDMRRGGAKKHRRNTLEAEGQTAVLIQDEVMTSSLLCSETAKEFLSDGSLSSSKCKKSSSVESYD